MKIGTVTMENSMEDPYKTKRKATIESINPTPAHISGENHGSEGYTHPSVHCSTV